MIMDWLFLIFLVPLILVPIVLLCGFAGCGLDVVGTGVFDAVPSNLNATAGGTDTINLSWKDNSVAASVFIVERGPPGGSLVPIKTGVKGVTAVDNPSNEGTTFLYDVRATAGVGGVPTAPSNSATVTTFPATPTNLVPTLTGASQVQFSWNNASATATKFSLEHRSSPGSAWTEIYKGTAKTSPASPLTPAGGDEYRVSAIVDGFDNSVAKEVRSIPSAPVAAVTEIPITPWKTAFNVPLTTDDPQAFNGNTIVQRIDAAHITNAGAKVRITLHGSTTGNLVIKKVTISQAAPAGQLWNSAADLTEVKSGGVSGVTIPANTPPKALDDTNYNLVPGKDLIVAFDISATDGLTRRATLPGPTMFSKNNTAEAATQNRSVNYLTHAGRVHIVEKIEVL